MKAFTLLILFWSSSIITYGLLLLNRPFQYQRVQVLAIQTTDDLLSPTSSPTPTLIPTLTPSPTLTPTLTPTPTAIPQPDFTSEQINGFIERFAGQYRVDPNVLRALAICESGFRAKAVNGSYWGLFQYNANTWKNNRVPMGEDPDISLRFNAEEATQTAAYMLSLGKGYAWPNCNP